jgi:hypothetical protein
VLLQMKWIDLTQGKQTCVDDDVFAWASLHRWQAQGYKHSFYAVRSSYKKDGPRRRIWLHREILGVASRAIEVNHIDGNGLTNLRNNLARASHADNQRAFQTKRASSSRFRGVSWRKDSSKWTAQIGTSRNHIQHLGSFGSEDEAARAYDQGAKRYFGELAQLNFPV